MASNYKIKSKDTPKQQNVAIKSAISRQLMTQTMSSEEGLEKKFETGFKKFEGKQVLCQGSACQKCKDYLKKVRFLSEQISFVKQKNMEMAEEIEMMSSNFSYIMELAAINITNGVQLRTKQALKEKQEIILKKNEIIKRLENESIGMIRRLDQEIKMEQRVKFLQETIKNLEIQNSQLRLENKNKVGQLKNDCNSSLEFGLKDTSSIRTGDISPTQEQVFEQSFTPLNLRNKANMESKVQQTKSLTSSLEIRNKSYSMSKNVKLEDLKLKINKIKNELLMQKV